MLIWKLSVYSCKSTNFPIRAFPLNHILLFSWMFTCLFHSLYTDEMQAKRRPNWYFPQLCSESLKSLTTSKQFTDRKQYFMVTELASGRQEVACSLLWVLYLHISYVHLHSKGDFSMGAMQSRKCDCFSLTTTGEREGRVSHEENNQATRQNRFCP